MDFVDDESRPRFLFQARSSAPSAAQRSPETLIKVGKIHAFACFSAALLLLLPAFYLSDNQALSILLVWIVLSLLVGPFAPPSLTGGDPRVGRGNPLPPPPAPSSAEPDEPKKRPSGRRPRSQPSEPPPPPPSAATSVAPEKPQICNGGGGGGSSDQEEVEGEKEWTDEDFEILKRQIAKHPVGAPRRWERIAEAFRGRHRLESVIRTAKSLSEKRPGADDSFAQFLKQRKPLDKRAEAINGDSNSSISVDNSDTKMETVGWSAGEDIALLNALKAFPKDVSMRWEKIAAAVPGKSKACCIKRVTELKRDFRSSKTSET